MKQGWQRLVCLCSPLFFSLSCWIYSRLVLCLSHQMGRLRPAHVVSSPVSHRTAANGSRAKAWGQDWRVHTLASLQRVDCRVSSGDAGYKRPLLLPRSLLDETASTAVRWHQRGCNLACISDTEKHIYRWSNSRGHASVRQQAMSTLCSWTGLPGKRLAAEHVSRHEPVVRVLRTAETGRLQSTSTEHRIDGPIKKKPTCCRRVRP